MTTTAQRDEEGTRGRLEGDNEMQKETGMQRRSLVAKGCM